MNRRELLLGGASAMSFAAAAGFAGAVQAQAAREVVIGVIYPMSGASAQVGIDARHAFETALDIVNNDHALDLIGAKGAGLPALVAPSCGWSSPTTRPTRRRAAPRPSA